jgi:hypothetical protein
MNGTPTDQQLRESIDKWDYTKLKSFYTAKEMVTRMKRQTIEWDKIFCRYTSGKGLITSIYRELKTLTSQRINNSLNKWVNKLSRQFSKEVQMAKEHMKKFSPFLAIKEIQVKTTLKFYLNPVRMTPINNTNNTNAG